MLDAGAGFVHGNIFSDFTKEILGHELIAGDAELKISTKRPFVL